MVDNRARNKMPKMPANNKAKAQKPAKNATSPEPNVEAQRQAIEAAAKKLNMTVLNWHPDSLLRFARGEITLAALDGMTQLQLNQMAEVGYNLLSQGKLEDARKIYAGLAVLNPYDPYYHLALGAISQRSNALEEAEKHYSRAIQINSGIGAAYANRAEVLIMLGKLNDAIGDLVQSVALSANTPNDPSSLRARATLNTIQQQITELQKKKTLA